MKLYKLTNELGQTKNKTQWGENVTHSGTGEGELCSPGWIHAYTSPLLAVLFNPIHAAFADPQLWEAEGAIDKTDGLKTGSETLTTLKRIPLPTVTLDQRRAFAILVVKEIYKDLKWNKWADNWLSGKDRSEKAAEAAAWAAAEAAAWAAAEAAWAAAWAAEVAAWAAARAAEVAAWASKTIDFQAIAERVIKEF